MSFLETPVVTICKFFKNSNTNSKGNNPVISRTLLKVAVVNKDWYPQRGQKEPKEGELWRVKIVKEINQGNNQGCFLVEPIKKLDEAEMCFLVPGTYSLKCMDNLLIVVPLKNQGANWILPLTDKKILAAQEKAYAVIVQIQEN